MARRPDAVLQVSGGGSGTGFAALLNGTTDLANASRGITEEERERIARERGARPVEVTVAMDAIAIYVHEDNPIEALSLTDLEGLFRGRIRRWTELGGRDAPVVLYSRENNSGTYRFFKDEVLDRCDFAPEAQTLPGTAAIINAVSRDPFGVGYGGIGYAEGVRIVPIEVDGAPVEPTSDNALSGRYPLARPLYTYAVGPPEGLAADYLTFVVSDDGQALVEAQGFFVLPDALRALSAQLAGAHE